MTHHILLLDDHPGFRESLAWFLRRERYDVRAVGDGDEAAGLLRQSHFDLVITDLKHPGMPGDRIKELSGRCIVVTGAWQEGCVHKSVPVDVLLEKVKQTLAS